MIGPRLAIGLAGLALFGALVFAVFYYQGAAHRAEGKAQVEHQQAANNAEAVKAVDHYEHTTTIIREQANAGVTVVQAAPGASQPLPDGVLSGWVSAIDGMRDKPPAASNPNP